MNVQNNLKISTNDKKDADFSVDTVKKLIQNGERDAEKILADFWKN